MITLQVEPYCHKCSHFEPETTKAYAMGVVFETFVRCEHALKCEMIEKHIRDEINKEKKNAED